MTSLTCFVTGASGFLGGNLVAELASRGHCVKALLRRGSDRRALRKLPCEHVEGDLEDKERLISALRGCDWCFHAAASYHLWLDDYAPMYTTNVVGTRNVLQAAAAAGCSRIVYTSTVGCIGVPETLSPNGVVLPADEDTPVSAEQMTNHYKRSKWHAEQVARELAAQGFPIVIVNPTAPAGPGDARPTPTGKVLVDFLNRQLPGYLDTGLNWVHVRDVAVGHVLAAQKGRPGERYILGHAAGNWTMRQMLETLSDITGLPAPRVRVPYPIALLAAHASETLSHLTGKPPKAPLAGVRMAKHKMYYNPTKAIRELALPQTPPRQALTDAVNWFQANGYVKADGS